MRNLKIARKTEHVLGIPSVYAENNKLRCACKVLNVQGPVMAHFDELVLNLIDLNCAKHFRRLGVKLGHPTNALKYGNYNNFHNFGA